MARSPAEATRKVILNPKSLYSNNAIKEPAWIFQGNVLFLGNGMVEETFTQLTPLLPCPKTVDMREMAVAVGALGAKMGM